ncbi:MAG: type III PLP-dependent enzyme [Synergistaceae bacterium]|nr:type III PLP-dependent enzyme [Synergistaceae bacterium]
MMNSFKLTEKGVAGFAAKFRTPFLVASLKQIEENYLFFRQHLPRARVYYAMKANPTAAILQRLASLGSCFDVASAGEMRRLHDLEIPSSRMIYANTVKDFPGLETSRDLQVRRFTFDDISEIPKMARYVPGADVLVRIRLHNSSALVDLNSKFGAAPEEALELLRAAKEAGLNPAGICFHVGSQSFSTASYEEALRVCRGLFDEAKRLGMNLTDIDIGGGFPIPMANGEPPDMARMLSSINDLLDDLFPDTAVCCEPGRFLCGTAVNLVTSVIGTKKRGGKPWYILDEGIYGAFSGILFDHWTYPITCFTEGEKMPSTLAGPSCDGIDVISRDIPLPPLAIGDLVLVTDIGAYSTVSATSFNGFPIAPTLLFEEEVARLDNVAR